MKKSHNYWATQPILDGIQRIEAALPQTRSLIQQDLGSSSILNSSFPPECPIICISTNSLPHPFQHHIVKIMESC